MTNDQNWDDIEFFDDVRGKRDANSVTITRSGAINLSLTFKRTYRKELDDNGFVKLGFSKKNHAIILEFVSSSEKSGTYKIQNTDTRISFLPRAFLKRFNIDYSFTRTYLIEKIDVVKFAIFLNHEIK